MTDCTHTRAHESRSVHDGAPVVSDNGGQNEERGRRV